MVRLLSLLVILGQLLNHLSDSSPTRYQERLGEASCSMVIYLEEELCPESYSYGNGHRHKCTVLSCIG